MIEVQNLHKKYGSILAAHDVSFTVNDGEILGFLGPNGAGKSTIMNILTGYISMTSGSVKISGYDISENPNEAKKHIGYLPEIPPLYPDMTVGEYLSFIYDLKKVKFSKAPHISEICELTGVDNVKNRLIKNLSKGYRQRVGLAGALIGNPEVLIFDEPTAGLDPRQITEVRDLIKRLGENHTVILSSHILSEIEAVCDRIIIINRGNLIADGTAESLAGSSGANNEVIVRVKNADAEVEDVLAKVSGVIATENLGETEEGAADYRITAAAGSDIRAAVIAALAEAGVTLLEIKKNEATLEQTFLGLVDASNAQYEEQDDVTTEDAPADYCEDDSDIANDDTVKEREE